MHHSGAKENPTSKLRAKEEKALIPPVKVGGDASSKGADQKNDQTPYFNQNQTLCMEVCSVAVVVSSVAVDQGDLDVKLSRSRLNHSLYYPADLIPS